MLYVLENPLKNGKNLKETHFKKKNRGRLPENTTENNCTDRSGQPFGLED